MNYQRIYDQIIERAKNRQLTGYKERHHIIPRCMGGTNEKSNLVYLTAREHFIVHKLLCEIYPEHHGLLKAYFAMAMLTLPNRSNSLTSREYNYLRIEFSKSNTGPLNHFYGKKHTDETRTKMRKNSGRKGKPPWNKGLTKDHPMVAKYASAPRWNTGLTKDDPRIQQQIKKSVQSRTGKKRGKYNVKYETCPHCNQMNTLSVIRRDHMDKCKYKL